MSQPTDQSSDDEWANVSWEMYHTFDFASEKIVMTLFSLLLLSFFFEFCVYRLVTAF